MKEIELDALDRAILGALTHNQLGPTQVAANVRYGSKAECRSGDEVGPLCALNGHCLTACCNHEALPSSGLWTAAHIP